MSIPMSLEKLQLLFSDASAETWHEHPNGGGWVQNTAFVEPMAYVGIDCIVYGDARVSGDAQVSGDAWVISPLQIMGTKHFVTVCNRALLSIGCEVHPIDWWKQHYRAIGRSAGYTKAQISEYRNYIELARVWMKIHGYKAEREAASPTASAKIK